MAYGLGSCVALVLCDPGRVAAMAHVVLPDSHGDARGIPAKFADTAVAHLAAEACRAGGQRARLRAVLCGGASMFGLANLPDIGGSNVRALRVDLRRVGIPVAGADVGGTRGRSVRVEVGTARVLVTIVGGASSELWAR